MGVRASKTCYEPYDWYCWSHQVNRAAKDIGANHSITIWISSRRANKTKIRIKIIIWLGRITTIRANVAKMLMPVNNITTSCTHIDKAKNGATV